jgi:RNA polymerase sigma-70 factor (ECF subfamily)
LREPALLTLTAHLWSRQWDALRMSPRVASGEQRVRRQADDPDSALVMRAQGGDREAFEGLVRRHADRLYAVVRGLGLSREATEEVTQESFLRAWRGIGAFRGEALFFTWLYRIGVNEAKRRLRHEPPRDLLGRLAGDGVAEPSDVRDEPHARVTQAELRGALAGAVRALPVKYRAPLVLRDIENLSTADAAATLGLGEAAFKSRLHRARVAVREAVSDHLERGR